MQRLGIVLVLLGLIVSISTIYLAENETYAQYVDNKKSYAEIHNLEPIIDKDGKKEFLILYKDRVKDKDVSELKTEGYATIKSKFDIMPAVLASMDEKWVAKIKAKKNVVGVYENYKVQAVLDNSIPQIGANLAQNSGLLGTGVKVCIIDTGVDDSHPAISQLVAQQNFIPSTPNFDPDDANDDNGHGTHVAGIVGSTDATYKGVAPGVSFMASKVLNSNGVATFAEVLLGINWCVANDADVLNLSLGGGSYTTECDPVDPNNPSNLIEQVAVAISNAYDQGVVTVAAAGNQNSPNKILAPACASRAIAVAGTDDNDNRYNNPPFGSNRGQLLDVAAPGVAIKSTLAAVQQPGQIQGGGFGTKTGTSMSSPHVAGAAALLMGYDPILSPGDVQNLLEQNAVDLGSPGFDTDFGWGRIDVWASLLAADTTSPVVTPPADITAEEATTTTPPGQAVAIGTATATDDVDLNPVITNNAPTLFPLGTTNVIWTATDASGNSATADQTVTIVDTTPPVVTPPTDITQEATSASGATVNYPPATATDDVGVTVGPDCTPISGSTFAIGDTIVTCTASDAAGNTGSATFTVTVQDTTPPVVIPPVSITAEATGTAAGDVVNYPPATATDEVGVTSGPTCTPTSGSMFPIGVTVVTCTASDAAGNIGSATFSISVQDLDDNFGIYRHYPSWGGAVFALSNVLSVPHDIVSFYGIDGDIPVTGDWDGDGVDTVGIYRHYPSWGGAVFALSNGFSEPYDIVSFYGSDGDVPVTGDWDGDGVDTVGIYRPLPGGGAMFALSNGFSEPFDIVFNYGIDGDIPVAGDWDGDGVDTVGIYRHYPSWGGAVFALSNGFSESYDVISFYGMDGDIPVAGDWD